MLLVPTRVSFACEQQQQQQQQQRRQHLHLDWCSMH
jgi:hypothetical protein